MKERSFPREPRRVDAAENAMMHRFFLPAVAGLALALAVSAPAEAAGGGGIGGGGMGGGRGMSLGGGGFGHVGLSGSLGGGGLGHMAAWVPVLGVLATPAWAWGSAV
jgi:hypothetical protein